MFNKFYLQIKCTVLYERLFTILKLNSKTFIYKIHAEVMRSKNSFIMNIL